MAIWGGFQRKFSKKHVHFSKKAKHKFNFKIGIFKVNSACGSLLVILSQIPHFMGISAILRQFCFDFWCFFEENLAKNVNFSKNVELFC